MKHDKPALACHRASRLLQTVGMGVMATAALCAGNAKAQQAVERPQLHAELKAGFPGNFDRMVGDGEVMLFHDLIPVLSKKGIKIRSRNPYDAVALTQPNQQYAALAFAFQGDSGSAYQITDGKGEVIATAFKPSQIGVLEKLSFTFAQDKDALIVDIASPAAGVSGGGGGGGGGGGERGERVFDSARMT